MNPLEWKPLLATWQTLTSSPYTRYRCSPGRRWLFGFAFSSASSCSISELLSRTTKTLCVGPFHKLQTIVLFRYVYRQKISPPSHKNSFRYEGAAWKCFKRFLLTVVYLKSSSCVRYCLVPRRFLGLLPFVVKAELSAVASWRLLWMELYDKMWVGRVSCMNISNGHIGKIFYSCEI